MVGQSAAASIVDANDIAAVNVNLAADTLLNTIEFSNVGKVAITNGVGIDSGAAYGDLNIDKHNLSTTLAVEKNRSFNVTVNSFNSDVSGKADAVSLSVAGAGTKTTAFADGDAQFDVSVGNAIETVNLATTGTNYVTLLAGTGASTITLTGDGANTVVLSSAATGNMLLDASATTGTNKITVGTLLASTNDTVKGGSGTDTLVATIGTTTLSTITGVENLDLTFSAGATFNASRITGVEALDITNTGAATISSLAATADTVTFDTSTAGAGATLNYVAGSAADLTVNLGKTTTAGTSTDAISIGNFAISNNTGAVTINSVSDKATNVNLTGTLGLGTASGLTVNANTGAVTTGAITGASVTSVALNATGAAIITGGLATASALESIVIAASAGNVTAGTFGIDNTFTSLEIATGTGTADYTTTITLNNIGTTTATDAVNGVVTISGSGDTSVTSTGAAGFVGSVDASEATGSVTLNFSAYTGTGVFDITLGDAATGETNTVNLAGATTGQVLTGGSGKEIFTGGSGDDLLTGNGGDDNIDGAAGVDVITGDAGADTIIGGTGADILTGGSGSDQFVYAASATGITIATSDTITDFTTAADQIKTGVVGLVAGDVAIGDGSGFADLAAFIATVNGLFGTGDKVVVAYNVTNISAGNGLVAIDNNGTGVFDNGDSLIVLTGINTATEIAAADFIA